MEHPRVFTLKLETANGAPVTDWTLAIVPYDADDSATVADVELHITDGGFVWVGKPVALAAMVSQGVETARDHAWGSA